MCHTNYRPDVPLPQQLSDLLHQVTTWEEVTDLIAAQLPTLRDIGQVIQAGGQVPNGQAIAAGASQELRSAAVQLRAARHHTLAAFRLCVAGQRDQEVAADA